MFYDKLIPQVADTRIPTRIRHVVIGLTVTFWLDDFGAAVRSVRVDVALFVPDLGAAADDMDVAGGTAR